MADDREILREIWEGRIPVQFTLAPDEVYTMDPPEPFYLLVPRLSYFPIVTDKVQRHFQKHVDPENKGDMWLEFDSQPLKWHYPIGLLYDMMAYGQDLPWTLTVHFDNFPEEELLSSPSKDAVESHYMSTVKEADALKHRCHVINGMQKKDHKQLWLGLQNDKFEQFWAINRKLMEKTGDDGFKFIPFRLYQADFPLVQKLYKPVTEAGDVTTLRDLIEANTPDAFDEIFSLQSCGVHVDVAKKSTWMRVTQTEKMWCIIVAFVGLSLAGVEGWNFCSKVGACDQYLMANQWSAPDVHSRQSCTDLCETRRGCIMASWNGLGTCRLHSQMCTQEESQQVPGQGVLLERHEDNFPCAALSHKYCEANQRTCVHPLSSDLITEVDVASKYHCMLECYGNANCESLHYDSTTGVCQTWKDSCSLDTLTTDVNLLYAEKSALMLACFADPVSGEPIETDHYGVVANV